MPKPIPTEQQVDEAWALCNTAVDALTFHKDYTIDDYPIGGVSRGKCKLEVEFKKHHGWRTKRTTTNRKGIWCKPAASTYQESPIVVVSGVVSRKGDPTGAWLKMDQRIGPYIMFANGDSQMLCEPPCYFRPQREDTGYKVRVNDGEATENMIVADDPLLCDAWERWFDHYKKLVQKVLAFQGVK